MADPLSIVAGIVGISAPALHGARLLLHDIQQIKGAPKAIIGIKNEIRSLEAALKSLQAVEQPAWNSLGSQVADQAKVTFTSCGEACNLFRADLQLWTKHSADGTLSWQDRVNVGFFKQRRIQALSDQLRSCYSTMNLVVSVATLYMPLALIIFLVGVLTLLYTGTALFTSLVLLRVPKQLFQNRELILKTPLS
jgi:hypothetical protein